MTESRQAQSLVGPVHVVGTDQVNGLLPLLAELRRRKIIAA